MKLPRSLLIAAIILAPVTGRADNSAPQAAQLMPRDAGRSIKGLAMLGRAQPKAPGAAGPDYVQIRGKFVQTGYTLVWIEAGRVSHKVPLTPDGNFTAAVPLNERREFEMAAIGPTKNFQRAWYTARFDNTHPAPAPVAAAPAGTPRAPVTTRATQPARAAGGSSSPFSFVIGAGYSSIQFQETGIEDLNQTAVTGKATGTYQFPGTHWELGLSSFLTLFPISHTTDSSARFLGVNVRGGYTFSSPRSRFGLSLLGGWYYTDMYVSGEPFGFRNMGGPQIFPVIRYSLTGSDSVSVYAKYAPVLKSVFSLQFQGAENREVAAGLAYTHRLSGGRPVSLSVDISQLYIAIEDIEFLSNTMTFGASIGL
jgi:hypothetical protein